MDLSGHPNRKRLFVIVGIITAGLLAIALVIIIVSGLGNRHAESKQAFNRFANYLLYGKDSADNISGDYTYGTDYYLGTLTSADQASDFLQQSQDKYAAFLQQAPRQLSNEAQTYADDLALFALAYTHPALSSATILELFLDDQANIAAHIDEYYTPFLSNKSEKVKSYGNTYKSKIAAVIDALQTLKDHNCVNTKQQTIANSCKIGNQPTAVREANTTLNDYGQFIATSDTSYNKLRAKVFSGIWELKDKIYEK